MRSLIIILTFLVIGYAYNTDISKPIELGNNSGCLTDELYGDFTNEELKHLVNRRKEVRELMNKNLYRKEKGILYVPIVFHNLYKRNPLSLDPSLSPITFEINQIYPNPFNPITTIRYGLNQNANIQVSIYDINGRLITTLINEFQITGYHFITWDASNFSSGIYFLNISAGEIAKTKKMVLIK